MKKPVLLFISAALALGLAACSPQQVVSVQGVASAAAGAQERPLGVLSSCYSPWPDEADSSSLPFNHGASSMAPTLTEEGKKDAMADAQPHNLGRYFDSEEGLQNLVASVVEDIIVNYDVGVYPVEGNPAIDPWPEGLALPADELMPVEWSQFIDADSGWTPQQVVSSQGVASAAAGAQEHPADVLTSAGTTVYEASVTLPLDGWAMQVYFPVIHGDDYDVSVYNQLPANAGQEVRFHPSGLS